MTIDRSLDLFEQACQVLPGGVDSPVRAFKAVGGKPLFIEKGEGAWLVDVDGNRYIDYVLSWGPLIHGHAHSDIHQAICEAAAKGTSFGAPSPLEIELARSIMRFMPNLELIRFVNSGTEATMSALRLARAFTKRDKIIKFEGCYHGHADMLLVQAGSGVATLGLPDSPGVPVATAADTLVAGYNDSGSVEALLKKFPDQVAAVIVEPVAGNMGVVPPEPGFLQDLRHLCTRFGALLILDEVMTGFRVHPGGAQSLYNIQPDLTTLGKVIGGGLPVGAYGGRRDVMQMVAPLGPMYQAGTLSGNPLAMAAGLASLELLRAPGLWDSMEAATTHLTKGLADAAAEAGIPIQQTRVGTMFTTFFSQVTPRDWSSVKQGNRDRYARFFQAMLAGGVYLAPSAFEAGFMSSAHGPSEIDATIEAAKAAFKTLK